MARMTLTRPLERTVALVSAVAPAWLAQLALRLAVAVPFWRSGVLKWDGFLQLNDTAVLLFGSEFKLHLPGGPYPFPAPVHVTWAAMALGIMAWGPGRISLDALLSGAR
jgi:putative oxidoreductase